MKGSHVHLFLYLVDCYTAGGYPCKVDIRRYKGHLTCLTKDQVCDGVEQCPYGDDESGKCGELIRIVIQTERANFI